jgi:pantoate--beta-alanine ligase
MIYHHHHSLNKEIASVKRKKQTIGFVPTMGALHFGHLTLVSKALEENDIVVVSIFVNPTQFDYPADLKKYPRTMEADANLLKTLKGPIYIYAPLPSDLYGDHVVSKKYDFDGLGHQMEGRFRQGHFDGVGSVLNLLFRAIKPDHAYFGEKDFQQLQIARKLVEIEDLPTKIVGCPIIREESGLAMSSRNKRLSPKLLEEAVLIHHTLAEVQKYFDRYSISKLSKLVEKVFQENEHLELEYFEITDIKNLKTAQRKRAGIKYRAFIAAFAGEVRLIDNIALN